MQLSRAWKLHHCYAWLKWWKSRLRGLHHVSLYRAMFWRAWTYPMENEDFGDISLVPKPSAGEPRLPYTYVKEDIMYTNVFLTILHPHWAKSTWITDRLIWSGSGRHVTWTYAFSRSFNHKQFSYFYLQLCRYVYSQKKSVESLWIH